MDSTSAHAPDEDLGPPAGLRESLAPTPISIGVTVAAQAALSLLA